MSEMSEIKLECNTNNNSNFRQKFKKKNFKPRLKAKTWLFTLNNPEKKIMSDLSEGKPNFGVGVIRYLIQEEMGKNKTHHLQGAIQFKSEREFNTVRSYLPKAHWEKSRSLAASFRYCGKIDTRCGAIFTYGDVEKYIEQEIETEGQFLDRYFEEKTGFKRGMPLPEFYWGNEDI